MPDVLVVAVMLLIMAVGVGVTGAAYLHERRAYQDFILRTRTAWMRAGHVIHFGPVAATCYGRSPQKSYTAGCVYGALALMDGHLEFSGYKHKMFNVRIAFEVLKWVGIRRVTISSGDNPSTQDALVVHYDSPAGWRVYTWTIPGDLEGFARELSTKADLPVQHYGTKREDFGPSGVTRMAQDIYGVWSKDRGGDLYLAPDRLIFGGRHQIPLHQIRAVNVISKGGWSDLNPFASELLQIEYNDQEGKAQTTAFLVRASETWARAIQERTGAALDFFAGRKKK